MKIVIDHREPEIFRTLFAADDEVTTAQLECGDFQVDQRWVFERKTIKDLCVSLVDGRFFRQAVALLQCEGHPVYILEGSSRQLQDAGVRREAVQGALITLSVFFGLPVLRSMDPQETARLIRYTVLQGVRFAEGGIPRHGYRPKGKKARQLFVLQGLPNIGKKRAEALLEHFGGIEAVMSAGEEELAEVNGIGAPIAEKIRNLIKETEVPYEYETRR